jgi:hypothetical protein
MVAMRQGAVGIGIAGGLKDEGNRFVPSKIDLFAMLYVVVIGFSSL